MPAIANTSASTSPVIVGGKIAEFVGVYELLEGLFSREENGTVITYCPAARLPQLIEDNKGKQVATGGHLIRMTAEEVRFFRANGRHRFRTAEIYPNGKGMEIEIDPVDLASDFTGASPADLISIIAKTTDPSVLDLIIRAEAAERARPEVMEFASYRKQQVSTIGG